MNFIWNEGDTSVKMKRLEEGGYFNLIGSVTGHAVKRLKISEIEDLWSSHPYVFEMGTLFTETTKPMWCLVHVTCILSAKDAY